MTKPREMTREERLAAKLRENLRRRKVQARALDDGAEGVADPAQGTAQDGALEPLSKAPPSR